jgi:arylformamidase
MNKFVQDGFTLIDVSHSVNDGMITYKGLPAPIICDYLTREASKKHYAEGTSFQIGVITMASNTGTYVDVPFHRYEDGKDLSEIALSSLANLDGIKITVPDHIKEIGVEHFKNAKIKGKAVLIQTNWSQHWGKDQYFENYPYVNEEAALYLRDNGAVFVGIDTYNIDDTTGKSRPCHSILLHNEIPICEHMTGLSDLPNDNFKFFSVPVKIKGMGTFPVRAFGIIKN